MAIALVLYGSADHAHVMKVTAVQIPFARAYDSWFFHRSRATQVLREVADRLDRDTPQPGQPERDLGPVQVVARFFETLAA